jgi:hypothetical protein
MCATTKKKKKRSTKSNSRVNFISNFYENDNGQYESFLEFTVIVSIILNFTIYKQV